MEKTFTLQEIHTAVCDYFQFNHNILNSKSQKKESVKARKLFCFLSREFTNNSFPEIGNFIKVTHADVIHHVNDVKIKKEVYPDIKSDIENIITILFKEPYFNLFSAGGNCINEFI